MPKKFNKKTNNKIYQNKDNFLKIIVFFLFETPIDNASKRSKSFKYYGWIYGHRYRELKYNLVNYNQNSKIHFYCENNSNRKDLIKKLKKYDNINTNDEFCIFYKVDSDSEIRSLFKILRNSLAHGEFVIRKYNKENMYYFENYSKKNRINAQLYLKETTLLEWIKIIENGPTK